MSATSLDRHAQDHMARLRVKMMQQKLTQQKTRPDSPDSEDEEQARLHRAMLKRRELVGRLRQEQQLYDDLRRPRTMSPRRYTPSPLHPPPSRRSMPELPDKNQTVRHVFEHKYTSLPPISNQPMVVGNGQPPVIQIGTGTDKPQSFQYPTVIQQPPGEAPKNNFGKGDFMEMMMMQNAQMNQLVMQQMMLSAIPQPGNKNSSPPAPQPQVAIPVNVGPEPPQILQIGSGNKRPPSVHHHHYGPPQQAPMGLPPPPHPQPVVHHVTQYPNYDRSTVMPTQAPPPPKTAMSDVFLFGIELKEAVAALHRIYLNPDGDIYPLLSDVVGEGAMDLYVERPDAGGLSAEDRQALSEASYLTENLTYKVTSIMPATGKIGVNTKSSIYQVIRNNKKFPPGYFWGVEKERLQFNHDGRTMNVGKQEASMLITSIFLSRALITTLLMKPLDYGLTTTLLGPVAVRNLKVLASIMTLVVRKASVPKGSPIMPIPHEIGGFIFADHEMAFMYEKLTKSVDYAVELVRNWGSQYVDRLRSLN